MSTLLRVKGLKENNLIVSENHSIVKLIQSTLTNIYRKCPYPYFRYKKLDIAHLRGSQLG